LFALAVRAAAGQYELDTPEQLLKLLATMARNKLLKARRFHQQARRDNRRTEGGEMAEQQVAAAAPSPSRQASAKELLSQLRQRLSDEERTLVKLRGEGRDWAEVAVALGGSPEGLRKKLARAVDRVAGELGLDDTDHG
jgi:RNA polymerase sigma-70 factor (ECF subfamily)